MPRRPAPEPDAFPDGPSKTQLKRVMHELQDLGVALLELPDAQLDEIEMEDQLRDALRELRRLRTFEAKRRQSQYVGKLLRLADDEPLRRAIDAYRLGKTREAAALHDVERWRDRLIADDEAITAWVAEHPEGDVQQLRTLIRNARREVTAAHAVDTEGGAPRKGRAYRELFQKLRAVLQTPAAVNQA